MHAPTPDPPLTAEHDIPSSAVASLAARVDALNRRAARFGFPAMTLTRGAETWRTRTVAGLGDVQVPYTRVRIAGQPMRIHGWSLACIIDHENQIVLGLPGRACPPRYWQAGIPPVGGCDQCHVDRPRKRTYVVAHQDGRSAQLGRECVRDYLGHPQAEELIGHAAAVAELLREVDGFDDALEPDVGAGRILLKPEVVLADVFEHLAGAPYEKSDAPSGGTVGAMRARYARARKGEKMTRTARSEALARDAIAWLQQQPDAGSPYMFNLKSIAKQAGIDPDSKAMNMWVSLPIAFEKGTRGAGGAHVGAIGERRVFDLVVERVVPFSGDFGTTYTYQLRDPDRNLLVWRASSELVQDGRVVSPGASLRLTCTVTDHVQGRAGKETRVNRCVLAKPGDEARAAKRKTKTEPLAKRFVRTMKRLKQIYAWEDPRVTEDGEDILWETRLTRETRRAATMTLEEGAAKRAAELSSMLQAQGVGTARVERIGTTAPDPADAAWEITPLVLRVSPLRQDNPVLPGTAMAYGYLPGRFRTHQEGVAEVVAKAYGLAEEALGVRVKDELLGCGSFGCVAPTEDGEVLKVTTDWHEVLLFLLVWRYDIPGFARISRGPVLLPLRDIAGRAAYAYTREDFPSPERGVQVSEELQSIFHDFAYAAHAPINAAENIAKLARIPETRAIAEGLAKLQEHHYDVQDIRAANLAWHGDQLIVRDAMARARLRLPKEHRESREYTLLGELMRQRAIETAIGARKSNPLAPGAVDERTAPVERIEEHVRRAESVLGVEVRGDVLGCGSWGCAAPLRDGEELLKVTSDLSEVLAFALAKDLELPGIARATRGPVLLATTSSRAPVYAYTRAVLPDASLDASTLAMVLQLAPPRSRPLDETLAEMRRDARTRDIADTIQTLRDQHWELRDIKPANLGQRPDGSLVLRDVQARSDLPGGRRFKAEDGFLGAFLARADGARHDNPAAPGRYFHGTSLEAAKAALADGELRALPPAGRYRRQKSLVPVAGHVYATSKVGVALNYARVALEETRDVLAAIVEVVPQEPCQADEDFLGEAVWRAVVAHRVEIGKEDLWEPQEQVDYLRYKALAATGKELLAAIPDKERKQILASKRQEWSQSDKARIGKKVAALLTKPDLDRITLQSSEVACRGAKVLRAWLIGKKDMEFLARSRDPKTLDIPASALDQLQRRPWAAKRKNPVTLAPTKAGWPGKSHGVALSSLPQDELARGAAHEHEHTPNRFLATRIAADHLVEDPAYYTHLEAMERQENPRPRKTRCDFNRYRSLPSDVDKGSPLQAYGHIHAYRLGSYWTVPVDVPTDELRCLQRDIVTEKHRLASVRAADPSLLPPVEIGVFQDGSAWIVDGNHRLAHALSTDAPTVSVTFTFVGQEHPRHENPRTHAVLPLAEVERWEPLAATSGVSAVARSKAGFLGAYRAAKGRFDRLPAAWRAKREAFLARHLAQAKGEAMFDGGMPTRRHLALVMWAYSPEPARLAQAAERQQNPRPRAIDVGLTPAELAEIRARVAAGEVTDEDTERLIAWAPRAWAAAGAFGRPRSDWKDMWRRWLPETRTDLEARQELLAFLDTYSHDAIAAKAGAKAAAARAERAERAYEAQGVDLEDLWREGEPAVRRKAGGEWVWLYHGTSSALLPGILQHGLRPGENVIDAKTPGVFLTAMPGRGDNAGAFFYARRAAAHFGGEPVVLRVLVPFDALEPDPDDEDIQAGRHQYVIDAVAPAWIYEVNGERLPHAKAKGKTR